MRACVCAVRTDGARSFLDDVARIATHGYEPSDDDVVRARLRTVGVQEHRLQFAGAAGEFINPGAPLGPVAAPLTDAARSERVRARVGDVRRRRRAHLRTSPPALLRCCWIADWVRGWRGQRAAWLPYFENVHALIFLAPISCIDERLAEDARVNRLEDSFLLWRAVCASPLLVRATVVLFLNKCDLLRRKLKRGLVVRHYLPSYGDRPNEMHAVVKCACARALCVR